jgi:hypothetical protein
MYYRRLKYSVYFPDNFDWVHGGKLPGLHGGNMHCTGDSDKPNGRNCFSTRLMWREGGAGYVTLLHICILLFLKFCLTDVPLSTFCAPLFPS